MKKEKQDLFLKCISSGKYRVIPERGIIQRYKNGIWIDLQSNPLPSGYIQYNLRYSKGKYFFIYGHVAVWLSVNGAYEPGMTINHKDFNRSNNRIDNLIICSQKQNISHSRTGNRYPKTNPLVRFNKEEVAKIRQLLLFSCTQMDIAKRMNKKRISVSWVCRQIKAGKTLKCEMT